MAPFIALIHARVGHIADSSNDTAKTHSGFGSNNRARQEIADKRRNHRVGREWCVLLFDDARQTPGSEVSVNGWSRTRRD